MNKITLLLAALICTTTQTKEERIAFCAVPVADVIGGEPLQKRFPNATPEEIGKYYRNFPNTNANVRELNRMHQLLFNELVIVVEENDAEYGIKMPNVIVIDKEGNEKALCGYVHKDALVFVDTFENPGDFLPPLKRHKQEPLALQTSQKRCVYTLGKPLFDPNAGCIYSLGTQFVGMQDDTDPDMLYLYRYISPTKQYGRHKRTDAPLLRIYKNCFIGYGDYAYKTKEDCMIDIAERMADNCPTTWGGRSYITEVTNPGYYDEVTRDYPDSSSIKGNDRPFMNNPRSGVDMSGMVNLLCKTCGIEFWLKNTTSMYKSLPGLLPDAPDDAGNFVLFHGYAGIRSKKDGNSIIEARRYEHHNGMMRKVPISKTFKRNRNMARFSKML